ncbi:6-phospho-3-hexuloisomerase [Paenarthrobacter aurescens]|uniref:6-phospho-3-hexuloisomerase n=1 Tax=Paenarthrobacter aurescens TaxID=43663 RepID=A0A4Y3NJ55_PAEAU|nr:6-phospho-3-hexuloisomerase [Paenarthrobacter aurescens]UKA50311.1 6-phospho-3-hexuloisomerase [Arthrobacter sp. FW305-123]MDO6142047.1 6-phospho-3-hexuloisomerase [Paenarthrobacter aurescens]MDO6145851.1 6-phospho-3-hexuloisomerase [Paenarthrobacter aurescens]MDO6157096.1 6-phospho-3-hexuloisomerase [Paenarthrobacter aurescens]MDO6161082.1 6-phospho-3-hexuloisomerase [Paenarthrobacter aurescens]
MDAVAERSSLSETAARAALNLSLIQNETAGTTNAIDVRQLADLAERIRGAERVFLSGAGRSGLVLRMAAMRLMHLGLTVHIAGDTTTPAITAGDLLLVASGSGTTSGVVKAAETAVAAGADVAAVTTNAGSPLAGLADALVIIPAAQKTDHGSSLSRQYSGSLFEQSLFLATEAVFQTLWESTDEPAEQLWLRHANLE